jgi:hypothetical protein
VKPGALEYIELDPFEGGPDVVRARRKSGILLVWTCSPLRIHRRISLLLVLALNPDRLISQYAHGVWRLHDGSLGGKAERREETSESLRASIG